MQSPCRHRGHIFAFPLPVRYAVCAESVPQPCWRLVAPDNHAGVACTTSPPNEGLCGSERHFPIPPTISRRCCNCGSVQHVTPSSRRHSFLVTSLLSRPHVCGATASPFRDINQTGGFRCPQSGRRLPMAPVTVLDGDSDAPATAQLGGSRQSQTTTT